MASPVRRQFLLLNIITDPPKMPACFAGNIQLFRVNFGSSQPLRLGRNDDVVWLAPVMRRSFLWGVWAGRICPFTLPEY